MPYLRRHNRLFLSVNCFYATFIPGLQEIITERVKERLPDAVILKLLDGAILFETNRAYDTLNFVCFNNIFAGIHVMEHTTPEGALESHITSLTRGNVSLSADSRAIIAHNGKKFHSFRVAVLRENKPAALSEKVRQAAEQYIARLCGLVVNRGNPDAEFWFLYRSEGFSLFMKRLTLRPSWEKSLHPGELPPPLAWTLCRLARLQHGDVALDPFCGYGSIPAAALKFFHITRCIAGDSRAKAAAFTLARLKNHGDRAVVHTADVRSLSSLLDAQSIDAIITDPPWGYYEDTPVKPLYEAMFAVFDTLLKPEGRLVILGGGTDDLTGAAAGRFTLRQKIPLLLSGKKAAIYLFDCMRRV